MSVKVVKLLKGCLNHRLFVSALGRMYSHKSGQAEWAAGVI
jgi:hypothetical protein